MLWDDDRDMLKSGINGLVNINREEDAYRSVIESGIVGTGVIESIDLQAQYVYIAVDWDSITIKERA